MFDFKSLFAETGTPCDTYGKNVIPGNVNIQCPFCTDHSNHLCCNPQKESVYCWKCGSKTLWALLDKIGTRDRNYYLDKYKSGKRMKTHYEKKLVRHRDCRFPSVEATLNPRAMAYLEARGYDTQELHSRYSIFSTGPVGAWKFRIMIPIYFGHQLVSFVGRDYTGAQELRYKTATKDEEAIEHKKIVYNLDATEDLDAILVVEGITDVWRMGPGSVATFGTSVTPAQVNLLANQDKPIYILFDAENEAQKKAVELQMALLLLGVETHRLQLPPGTDDPGNLSAASVAALRKQIWKTQGETK